MCLPPAFPNLCGDLGSKETAQEPTKIYLIGRILEHCVLLAIGIETVRISDGAFVS